jgi:Glycosyltransferase family 87
VRKLIAPLVALAALLAFAPAALASSPPLSASATDATGVGLPIVAAKSMTVPPPHFSSDAEDAVKAAERSRTMDALHAREHPLRFEIDVWNDHNWFVNFYYRDKLVAEAVETSRAKVTAVWTGPLASAVYARGDFATQFGQWWILVPFSVLFVAPFLDPRRWRRMLHLDALVLLCFLASYLLFDHAKLVAAVWLFYPPLLYLLARMAWLGGLWPGRRGGPPRLAGTGLSSLLSVRVLGSGLVVLVLARIALSLTSATVIDVGYASVIGAHHIVAGQPLYFLSPAHSDTYGPIAYLAYVPFELLFPWHGAWNYLPSAHVASIVFDLVTIGGLVALGRRLRPGRDGLRLGLALGWAWSACPFTLLALMMHSNDGLIAMLTVLSLLAFSSPGVRGAALGLAAAAKFAPAALLGLYAGQRDRGLKGVATCVAAFAIVVVASIGLYLPSGGLSEFYNHTLGFQISRQDVFSIWALHPGLNGFKIAVEVGALLLCAVVAFVPRRTRTLAEVCALGAVVTIAVQLPAVHWFYYFIVWFVPFVLVALLAGPEPIAPPEADVHTAHGAVAATPASEPEIVPAGV